jgi:predicted negative regulator of RcsB-dependent stress response
MALDLHEQEQIEALKAWWKDNGKSLLLAVVLAAGVFGAVYGWKYWHAKQNADAAMLFAEVMKQVSSNDPKRVNDAAAAVVSSYGSTIYAVRADLLAAQVNIQVKDTATAATQLQWVIDHAADASLQDVARLKLASLRLDEKKYDEAIKLLDAAHPDAFAGLYVDLKGDVLSAQGKTEEARAAYKQAFDKTDAKSMYRNLIQMKLDALGGAK